MSRVSSVVAVSLVGGVVTGLLLASSGPLLASPIVLEACHHDLTERGRATSFKGSLVFELDTNEEGLVEEAELLEGHDLGELIDDLAIAQCVMSWRLEPETTYDVTITVGTAASEHTISVKGRTGLDLTVRIPGDGTETADE